MYLTPDHRIALLMHGGTQSSKGKTGLALLRYSANPITVVVDQDCAGQQLAALTGINHPAPIVASVQEALAYKPEVLVIGIAPSGGALPEAWLEEIRQAVAAGLHVVNGLHTPMATDPRIAPWLQPNQWIWDVRQEPSGLTVGSGKAQQLPCRRVLTVGTDMSVGKMSTTLELCRTAKKQGFRAKVIATGQTNLMLGDDGVALDAVRVDFASGAVEAVMMRYGNDYEWLFVEGQGSLLNPASTATLPLLRGTQPTDLILVHRANQTHIHNCPEVQIPPLSEVIHLYETVASGGGAFTPARVVGIALNTGGLAAVDANRIIDETEQALGLPCTDVVRFGADKLFSAMVSS